MSKLYRGVYTAAMGMLVDITKIDTLSNNLANVETNGYKADTPTFKAYFNKEIDRIKPEPENRRVEVKKIGNLEQAVILDEVRTNFSQGILEQTNVPSHIAINGDGFFAVRKANEIFYTRNGEFIRDSNGRLVNTQGNYLLNQNGQEIVVPETFSIDEAGNILDENGNVIDRIAVYALSNPRKIGDTLFTGQPQNLPEDSFRILPGYIEKSNVNVVREMVKMIEAHRHYEATSKAIVVHDELLNKVINNVGALR
ncbi:flagellar basal-body rod protein FlgF [Fervidobacterium sp. 2310opik-2]|uniref:flagellar basal-body rod protein FlgF n=1 Tax=Fervidobacterium sp. 2310opik-2 TaxID=1755815 RepID=UPI00321647CE